MDGFRVFMNCICMCVFAAGPMRLGDFAPLGNDIMGGGVPVETLVHGDPAPAEIASAHRPTSSIVPLENAHSNAPLPNNAHVDIPNANFSTVVQSAASQSIVWR